VANGRVETEDSRLVLWALNNCRERSQAAVNGRSRGLVIPFFLFVAFRNISSASHLPIARTYAFFADLR
jgi:hypothetical protein